MQTIYMQCKINKCSNSNNLNRRSRDLRTAGNVNADTMEILENSARNAENLVLSIQNGNVQNAELRIRENSARNVELQNLRENGLANADNLAIKENSVQTAANLVHEFVLNRFNWYKFSRRI